MRKYFQFYLIIKTKKEVKISNGRINPNDTSTLILGYLVNYVGLYKSVFGLRSRYSKST
jgi:hypothetical protein